MNLEESLNATIHETLHEMFLVDIINCFNKQLDNLKDQKRSKDQINKKRVIKILINENAKNIIESMNENVSKKLDFYLNEQTIDNYTEALIKSDATIISQQLTSSFESILTNQLEKCKKNHIEASIYLLNLKLKMLKNNTPRLDILISKENTNPEKKQNNETTSFQEDSSTKITSLCLKVHLRTHPVKQSFSCDQCSKKFKYRSQLKIHMMTHTDERPFSCDQCQKGFYDFHCLKSHMLTHTGERLFNCEKCTNKFKHRSALKRHISIHTGERPYKCDKCPISFRLLQSLKTHKMTHQNS